MPRPVRDVDLVVTPACSPELIGALKRKYPDARIVVVELDDSVDRSSTRPICDPTVAELVEAGELVNGRRQAT